MNRIATLRFAAALGTAAALFYVACMIFMGISDKETVVWVFNCLMHGVDVTKIVRDSVPLGESIAGLIMTWISGALFGWLAASMYNLGLSAPSSDASGTEH